jgi:phenylpropionate dioxygenase-like ring-hydroxylating dioxygenase large terminal subunit
VAQVFNVGVDVDDPSTIPSYAQYWKMDRGSPPAFLIERSEGDIGPTRVPKEVFTSAKFHQLEMEKLWKRVWQAACRENDIPDVGDWLVYDIGDQSVIVVRVAPDKIRAFPNACLHRGNRLFDGAGSQCDQIRCSYHGWSWDLNGSIKEMTCRWDFGDVDSDLVRLVDLPCTTFAGWVFINLDLNADSLDCFLGPDIVAQVGHSPYHRSWKAAHIAKVIPCNWKAMFHNVIEFYHLETVHRNSVLSYTGDLLTQYDFYGPHSRFIAPFGVPSPYLGEVDEQAVLDSFLSGIHRNLVGSEEPEHESTKLGPEQTARQFICDFLKAMLSERCGDLSHVSDTEAIDALGYAIFPNLNIWTGYVSPFVIRVRPHGNDHSSCLMEVMTFVHMPEGHKLPRDVPMRMTPSDETWTDAKDIANLALPLDEDTEAALLRIQRGMQNDNVREIILASYHEGAIRNLHHHINQYVEA